MPEVGKFYWIRLYRDDAQWRLAQRVKSVEYLNKLQCWKVFDDENEWYDTEVNEVSPEVVPPAD